MSDRIFVGTRKGLFTITRSAIGGSWRVARVSLLGDPVSMVLEDRRDGTVYAAMDHAQFGTKLMRSTNGGETFEEWGTPAYPEKPEGVEDVDPFRKTPIPWKLKTVWSLESGGPDEKGVLWCGTIPGGLFKSGDGGSTWELVRSLWDHPTRKEWAGGGADFPGIHSICVHPKDSKRVLVAVSCGGAWETTDGGGTWASRARGMRAAYMPPELQFTESAQDPHRVVQCAARPDVFWCQHHNGIFRSTDGARSWTEIEKAGPSVFGFGVVVHPEDPETAWFVPATKDERRIPVDGKVVVTRTRDGGQSFEVLTEGLPQEHAYDLTFRHALDIDRTGKRLAFGSTTGSLWVSESQGDTWKNVSTHLPPVYCVRFA